MNRLFNILIASVALILTSPIMAVIALLVRYSIGRPVLFSQRRPGLHEELFELTKFRTMRNAVDEAGEPLPDAERMTRFGTWLRNSSLDELPELWGVVKGDMNLVGPRPLLVEYLQLYSDHQRRRHEVRPGITGWAQVNGRNRLSWEEKFDLDVWYVDHRSLWLDLKILGLTLLAVFRTHEISQDGHVTAERFKGSK